MKFYFCLMTFTALIVLVVSQDETTPKASELCSLNKLIDDKCTKEDDIPCRRCYFKACHTPGVGIPLRPAPLPGGPDNLQFGRPFAPQDCEALKTCLEEADCKDE